MKKVFSLIGIIVGTQFIVSSAIADTEVSGVISTNTIWDPTGSPYIVTGHVLVESTVTLDIEPGVEVRIDEDKYIMIKGTLNAIGTEADSIIITKNGSAKWQRLWFKKATSGSLKYCRIEYACKSAIYSDSASSLVIEYNTISNNSAEFGGGICSDGSPTITNNTITNNSADGGGGICSDGSPTITNNTITNNSAAWGGGIYSNYNSSPTIKYNTITNNSAGYGGGIQNMGSPTITGNTISNNSAIGGYGGGICSSAGGSPTITGNTISNNFTNEVGGGICSDGYGSLTIKYNTITDTTAYAIYIDIDMSSALIDSNNLYITGYAVYNNSKNDINAQYNYWGTTDSATIANQKIWDYYDDFDKGIVYYEPFLASGDTIAPVPPPLNLTADTTKATGVTLSWDSVFVADLSGYKVWYDTDTSSYPYNGTGANEGNSPIDVGNVTTFELTGLTASTYYIAVTAYDNSGDSSWYSNEVKAILVEVEESSNSQLTISNPQLSIYPNPSFGNALIKYGLPEKASISLGLYDTSGRLVKTLCSGNQEKGYHKVDIRNDELAKGVYFIKFKVGDYKATKKLILMR